jgi:hypothetical protein
MTTLSMHFPEFSFQKSQSKDGSSAAAAAASAIADPASAAAAAAASASTSTADAASKTENKPQSMFEGFQQLDKAIGSDDKKASSAKEKPQHAKKPEKQNDQKQNPLQQMLQQFMQMMMQLLQMLMQMLGLNNKDQQQQQNPAQNQNAQQPKQAQPFQVVQPNSAPQMMQPAQQPQAYQPQQNQAPFYQAAPQQLQPQQNQIAPPQQAVQPAGSSGNAAAAAAATGNSAAAAAATATNQAPATTVTNPVSQPVQAPANTEAKPVSQPAPAVNKPAEITTVQDAPATAASAASASAEKTVSIGDSGKGTPVDQIPENEIKATNGDDLNAKGRFNENKYVVYDGHLYKEKMPNMYSSVVRLPAGKNNLYLSRNADIEKGGNGGYDITAKASGAASSSAASDKDSASAASAAAASADIQVEEKPGTVSTVTSKERTMSPLILDTNKDGKVSAEQGKGVDIDGDGKADGAATGGDKMLSLGDVDGDGQITGKEVFGDQTVDPFTGEKIKAENGFEALKTVAKSAEEHTGIKCIDDEGNVDAQKLKMALEISGKGSLGLISDDNNKNLEDLGDVHKINVNNYTEVKQTGDVQHNQQGTYTTTDGKTHKVDDVWFKLS